MPYQLTPAGTCIEGDWDEVMAVIRKCHERARKNAAHVVTMIKVEDEAGATNKLERNITSIALKLNKSLR